MLVFLKQVKKFGNMNTQVRFYSEGYTLEEIKVEFLARRMLVWCEFGFDGHKMFMADEMRNDGSYFEIIEDYVIANPNGWSVIPDDNLIVSENVTGVMMDDTITNLNYYSNSASSPYGLNDASKASRHFVGLYYLVS